VSSPIRFEARLLRPADLGAAADWGFVVLPPEASALLPRRGRTTVDGRLNGADGRLNGADGRLNGADGRLNGAAFRATLEPDGHLSHWLRVDGALISAARAVFGALVRVELRPVVPEPEPEVPGDLQDALAANPGARAVWEATTTLARVDWIHWITSAKRGETRAKRIRAACDKLAAGERRVCCFDPSGCRSRAFGAPTAAEEENS